MLEEAEGKSKLVVCCKCKTHPGFLEAPDDRCWWTVFCNVQAMTSWWNVCFYHRPTGNASSTPNLPAGKGALSQIPGRLWKWTVPGNTFKWPTSLAFSDFDSTFSWHFGRNFVTFGREDSESVSTSSSANSSEVGVNNFAIQFKCSVTMCLKIKNWKKCFLFLVVFFFIIVPARVSSERVRQTCHPKCPECPGWPRTKHFVNWQNVCFFGLVGCILCSFRIFEGTSTSRMTLHHNGSWISAWHWDTRSIHPEIQKRQLPQLWGGSWPSLTAGGRGLLGNDSQSDVSAVWCSTSRLISITSKGKGLTQSTLPCEICVGLIRNWSLISCQAVAEISFGWTSSTKWERRIGSQGSHGLRCRMRWRQFRGGRSTGNARRLWPAAHSSCCAWPFEKLGAWEEKKWKDGICWQTLSRFQCSWDTAFCLHGFLADLKDAGCFSMLQLFHGVLEN